MLQRQILRYCKPQLHADFASRRPMQPSLYLLLERATHGHIRID